MFWIILIAIVAFLVAWVISAQRNLVKFDELCGNSMSQIGVQLSSRWDAVGALVQLTKNYDEHEYNTLNEITARRAEIGSKSTAADAQAQDDAITQLVSRIMAVAESYPDLKANTVYNQTMTSLNEYENNVRTSRMVYNDSVTKYNRYVRQFPASLVAGALGFLTREYLKADDSKADMPAVN
ncbi:MAG: LemA family protein [Oscillospiraceae bacterium]|nr:LemA family protein [Oscillospiraceae bacterium]